MKQRYIDAVAARIADKTARAQIIAELEEHLRDKTDYYTELGYPPDEAERRAAEDMGDPDDAALPLRTLHDQEGKTALAVWLSLLLHVGLLVHGVVSVLMSWRTTVYSEYGVAHTPVRELASLAVVAACMVLLYAAGKRKSKTATVLVMLTAQLEFFATSGVVLSKPLFTHAEPALYLPAKTLCDGIGAYTDSLLTGGYIPTAVSGWVSALAMAFLTLIWLWGLLQLILIILQERMCPTRGFKRVVKGLQSVLLLLMAANILVTAVCAGIAAIRLPEQGETAREQRLRLMEAVFTTELGDLYDDTLSRQGFRRDAPDRVDLGNPAYYYRDGCNACVEINSMGIQYFRTDRSRMLRHAEETGVTPQELQAMTSDSAMTLTDFLKIVDVDKAVQIVRYQEDGQGLGTEQCAMLSFAGGSTEQPADRDPYDDGIWSVSFHARSREPAPDLSAYKADSADIIN